LSKAESHEIAAAEVDHDRFTEWFHIDNLTEFTRKFTNCIRRGYFVNIPAFHIEDAVYTPRAPPVKFIYSVNHTVFLGNSMTLAQAERACHRLICYNYYNNGGVKNLCIVAWLERDTNGILWIV
jgi:hypothetical protein